LAYQLSFLRDLLKLSCWRQPIEAEKQANQINLNNLEQLYFPSLTLNVLASAVVKIAGDPIRRLLFAFLLLIRWPPQERLCLTLPLAVNLTLFFSPLWVFCFGI